MMTGHTEKKQLLHFDGWCVAFEQLWEVSNTGQVFCREQQNNIVQIK